MSALLPLLILVAIAMWLIPLLVAAVVHVGTYIFAISFAALLIAWPALELRRQWPWREGARWGATSQVILAALLWATGQFEPAILGRLHGEYILGMTPTAARMIALSGLVGVIVFLGAAMRAEQRPPPPRPEQPWQRLGLAQQKWKSLAPSDGHFACVISVEQGRFDATEFSVAVVRLMSDGVRHDTIAIDFQFDEALRKPLGDMRNDFASLRAFIGDLPLWLCSQSELDRLRAFNASLNFELPNLVALLDIPLRDFFGTAVGFDLAAEVLDLDAGETGGPVARAKLGVLLLKRTLSKRADAGLLMKLQPRLAVDNARLGESLPSGTRAWKRAQDENAEAVKAWFDKQRAKTQ